MNHGSWTAGILAALASFLAMEASAGACGMPYPGVTEVFPASGATTPGNAALFFAGHALSLDAVSVTVDAEPARLVAAPDVPAAGYDLVARIEPPPGEGQAIVIEGSFCPDEGCEATRIELTAGAADTEAPPTPSGLSFDLYDYADATPSSGSCESHSHLAWWVTAEGEAAGTGESPVIYTVEAFRDVSFTEPVFSTSRLTTDASVTMAIHQTVDVLAGVDAPTALCFRATAMDAAGNVAGEAVHACRPCFYRKDPETAQPSSSRPSEPEWTEQDVYPGGTCDSGMEPGSGGGGAGDGDDDEDAAVRGCSCRAAGERGPGGAAALGGAALALLACAARARRRERCPH
ncbi:hypothetical protein WME98_01775 [Sorangium sp. So ce296]|uniref:hypothetical protein n=1 Tax=Sorangium sp. So ce296 TaxID=3133296 RepID=UPI003F5D827A